MSNIIYIPNGPKNLANTFPLANWADVVEYFVEALDISNNVLATTTVNCIGCCCGDDKVRLHFLNYLGTFDAVNFMKPAVTHETNFSEFEKGLPNVLSKPDTGIERFNIKPNDLTVARTNCYSEANMLWLQELADSPKVYMEWKGIQGQADSFIPVVITSKKFEKIKNLNDFRYDFVIEFKLSNEYLTLRN